MWRVNVIFVILFSLNGLNAWRHFNKGRMSGGNIGIPNRHKVTTTAVETKWFNQTLDHSEPTDTRTWLQQYQVNDQFFQPNGPVFIMIGGEGPASDAWMTAGAWVDNGKKYNALLFQLEHRYYGNSHPTSDLSTSNLKYLTSEQALADLAVFISAMNEQYSLPNATKWIAFGGSYSGSLAAWLRLRYPHLVHGAVSTSGPLLAEVDFLEYFEVVEESLATYSDDCVTAIKDGNDQIETLLTQEIGQHKLDTDFKLCENLENLINDTDQLSNFVASLADNFAGVVQYNKDNRMSQSAAGLITIDDLCGIMVNQSIGTPVDRLAAVNALMLDAYGEECLDYNYNTMIEAYKETDWNSGAAEGGRQWTYQTCTEFGFYQTSSYKPQVFGQDFPIDFFIKQCADIFGPEYTPDFLNGVISRTNQIYGALDIEVTNTVFVHGSIDPWHALGITKTREQGAPAIYINGTAHCANMYPPSDKDLPSLKAARVQIEDLIGTWLDL